MSGHPALGPAESLDPVSGAEPFEPRGGQNLVHLIAEQIARTPEAPAAVHDEVSLSYAELGRRAGGLATELRHRGVGRDVVLGVCVQDPLDRVVAVLAIWEAGGAYLPLDPDDPPARLRALLSDSGAMLTVVDRVISDRVLPAGSTELLPVTEDIGGASIGAGTAGPNDLAYLMYTSGTTGKPKGVAVEHGGVIRYLCAAFASYLKAGPGSVVLQLAPCTFDPWLREVVAPLVSGGTVVLLRRRDQRDPERLLAAIRRHGVTDLMGAVPSMLLALAGSPSFDTDPISLNSTLVSGESFRPVRQLGTRLRAFGRLVNHYGQTECTLIATYHEVADDDPKSADLIGRPLPGVSIQLLDDDLEPVRPGMADEIWTAGANLARGYWRMPAETARAFQPDPLGPPGARRYRTGDRGRWLPGGVLELLGRSDLQINLRGHRIEPAEVESALIDHPDVIQAAVTAARRGENQILVAHLVTTAPGAPEDSALRLFLGQRLPAYAVPTMFVPHDALPLGSSGKVDRAALQTPVAYPDSAAGQSPGNAVEAMVAAAWSEVLGVSGVALDADFFALGGHSLRAGEIAGRLRQIAGVNVTVEQVLRNPTVAQLAATLFAPGPDVHPIEHRPDLTVFPLSLPQQRVFAQQRLYGLDEDELASGAYVVQIAYRLVGTLQIEAMRRAVAHIVTRHEALRTAFETHGVEVVGRVVPAGDSSLRIDDLLGMPIGDRERRATELIRHDGDRPFDLAAGSPMRVRLVRIADGEHVLSLTFHHIISDGWSVGLFLRELSELYNADVARRPMPLTELAIQYGDYALWQRDRFSAEVLDEQLNYWRAQLQQLSPLALPANRPRAAKLDRRGRRRRLTISRQLTRALHAAGRAHGASLHMVLCGGLAVLLTGLCDQRDIAFATPVANRNPPEVERLIGVFTNTIGVRVDLSDDPCFADVLVRVREMAIEAYAHQDLPYERVVETLTTPEQRAAAPMLQVLLALQNAPMEPPELSGIEVSQFDCDRNITKYDLVFSLTEVGGALGGYLEYRQALFEASTADRIGDALQAVLAAVTAEARTPISALLRQLEIDPSAATGGR